ncbi:hypothetical protein AOA12_06190 [Microbacterium sp. No. 7]|nr:hypothetical protein AOA12_06190 [Microbacterium sp. No. 7]
MSTRRTNVLRHASDEKLHDTLRSWSRLYDDRRRERLTDGIRKARRVGWTYGLIADALRMHPTTVSRMHRAWQDKHYPI